MVDIKSTSTRRADLGQAIWGFGPEQSNRFIANDVLPGINVSEKSGSLQTVPREGMLEDEVGLHADGAGYPRTQYGVDEVSYKCKEYGLEISVPKGNAKQLAQDGFDAEFSATKILMGKIMLAREVRVANKVFDTAKWTGSDLYTALSGTAYWTAFATADPIGVVEAASDKIQGNTGYEANTLIMNKKTHQLLSKSAQLIDRLTGARNAALNGGLLDLGTLAFLLNVEKIHVASSVKNTADEGQPFASGQIWSQTYCMAAYIPAGEPGIEESTIGRSFFWDRETSKEDQFLVETYSSNETRSDMVRTIQVVDENIIDPAYAHLIKIRA